MPLAAGTRLGVFEILAPRQPKQSSYPPTSCPPLPQ